MNFSTFKKLSKEYKTVPVYKRILADLLTPISAYMRLTKESNFSFILESAEQGEGYGRYSFIGKNPHLIIEEKGLKQITNTKAIEEEVDKVLAGNEKMVQEYLGGKDKLLGFFVGQAMKNTGGTANPKVVNEILLKLLKG